MNRKDCDNPSDSASHGGSSARLGSQAACHVALIALIVGSLPSFALAGSVRLWPSVVVVDEANRMANVRDLLEALNRLDLPFKDRVSILEEIHRAGKLHAQLLYKG